MEKTIKNRFFAKTPTFFKNLRNYGLALAALGSSIITAPATFGVIIPAGILTAAGYLATAGTVAASISQLVTTQEQD